MVLKIECLKCIHEFFQIFLDIFNIYKKSKTKTTHDRIIKMLKNTSYIEN